MTDLAATAKALADRGIARIGAGLGGDQAHLEWPARLSSVMRAEAQGEGWWQPLETLGDAGLPTLYRRAADVAIASQAKPDPDARAAA